MSSLLVLHTLTLGECYHLDELCFHTALLYSSFVIGCVSMVMSVCCVRFHILMSRQAAENVIMVALYAAACSSASAR